MLHFYVRPKLVRCSCVCHGLEDRLCILSLIFDLLWRELFSNFSFLRLASLKGGPCLIMGFSSSSLLFCSFRSLVTIPAMLSCYSLLWWACWASLGLLPILLSMIPYGHCIYTHATLGFLNPLHCLWAPLSHLLSLDILGPFAFLGHLWLIF